MFAELIALGFMVGEYVYHRLTSDGTSALNPSKEVDLPRNDQGAPYPLLYGRCRVLAPIVAWCGTPSDVDAAPAFPGQFLYFFDMHLIGGIPFRDRGQHRLHGVYVGDKKLTELTGPVGFSTVYSSLSALIGAGGFEDSVRPTWLENYTDQTRIRGSVEFLNGWDTQILIDPAVITNATTSLGNYMLGAGINGQQIPGYRGLLSVFFYGLVGDLGVQPHWMIGTSAQLQQYSLELGSYPDGGSPPLANGDVNPVDVLLDLIVDPRKLGKDLSRVDLPNFFAARTTLNNESHGMARVWDAETPFSDMIAEIERQTDGIFFEDPTTNKYKFKLIRADFDPPTIPVIDPTNCSELQNFSAGGQVDLPSIVTIKFTDRSSDYNAGSGVSQNPVNAVGQDGETNKITLDMPGVTNQTLANAIAEREQSARARPLMKCRAIVNRALLRVLPGDAVKLNWPEANISGVIFRVGAISRGTLENPAIALDLIQDYFYTHRNVVHPPEDDGGGGVFGPPV